MKKKLTLKLIETNDTPKIGDLTKTNTLQYILRVNTYADLDADLFKVVLPYGISDEEIKEGDNYLYYYREQTWIAMDNFPGYDVSNSTGIEHCFKKVEILPEQFNYQDIVDLGLKDGDILNVKSLNNVITLEVNKVTLLKYPEKHYWFAKGLFTYNEEQFDIILNEFGNALMNAQGLGQYQKSSNGVAQFVIDYLKKKKDGN